jgi:hypothetical protein
LQSFFPLHACFAAASALQPLGPLHEFFAATAAVVEAGVGPALGVSVVL